MLKVRKVANRVSDSGAVFMTAVLEYLTAEILEVSLDAARQEGLVRIKARHVNTALKKDPDLGKYFAMAIVPNSKFVPKD
ncbi:unnamed protein product [Larinioides sclopetarius]